ncbi:hypothetical protein CBOM_03316 [Ceraceosorus bombacis]|uniref:Uncharacterized protein n=1 Tax=Ceraceosorus bombacis TaxID=401625 RepID=A0A0P1BNN2_9BASI|nr:hypothetical protein CBOM_03316 [Ceraceosorus bombacis]
MSIAAEVSLDEVRRHVDAIFEHAQEQDDRQRMIFAARSSPSPSPTPLPTTSRCEVSCTPDASDAKKFGHSNGRSGCHHAPGASACNATAENDSQTQRQTPAGMRGYVDTRKIRAADARKVGLKKKAATEDEIALEEVDLLDPQETWHKRSGDVSLTCWHYGEDGPLAQLTHTERASFAMFEMEIIANGWSLRLSGPTMDNCRLTIQRPDGREDLEQDAVEG